MHIADPADKPESASKPKKTPVLRSSKYIADIINGGAPNDFPAKLHVLKDGVGGSQILEEDDRGVVRCVSKERVYDLVMEYIYASPILRKDSDGFAANDPKTFVRNWVAITPNFEKKIHNILPAEAPGLCWHRLAFAPAPGPHPLWDELMSRTSNIEALQQWIGSLFHEDADRQTYIWLFGQGGDGKGVISRLLSRAFGDTSSAQEVPSKGDGGNRFWTHGILGKRLVVFNDCNNFGFPMRGLFKSLTGDDRIRVEEKGGKVFSANLNCMFIFSSNEKPLVEKEADLRRAIFCSLKPPKDKDNHNYEEDLWKEAAYIIGTCMRKYKDMRAAGLRIKADRADLEDIADLATSQFESVFYRNFELVTPHNVNKDAPSKMPTHEVSRILKEEGIRTTHEVGKFYDWLAGVHGIRRVSIKIAPKQVQKFALGVRPKAWQNL